MPITYVLKITVPPDQTIQQYKESLEKRLAALKPRRLNNKFFVQTVVYQSNTNPQCHIHQFLHSDYSATCFSIIDSNPNLVPIPETEIKVLTGDIGLACVQRTISQLGILTERKPLQIECTGTGYKIGDFQVKLGAVTHNSSNRGLLAEISYSSATNNNEAYGLISEFVQSYFGWAISNDMLSNLVRKKVQTIYTPEDTIRQYYEHFNFFRPSSTSQQRL
jgi:hypothetical protein